MSARQLSPATEKELAEKRIYAAEWLRQLIEEQVKPPGDKTKMEDSEYCALKCVSAQADYTLALLKARQELGTQ
jgi:hypothetical protein